MDRLRQVVWLAVFACPLATGCAGLHEARHTALQQIGIEAPAPATEFACAWQNRLAQLPDPTKNGANVTGLPGQMFLFTHDLKPAVPMGDLTVVMIDETPRPQGTPRKMDEVWHFGKDKLEKMVAIDERFGKNFVIFIPWQETWRDVSRVRLKARYDQTIDGKQQTLYAQDSLVTLDFVSNSATQTWPTAGFVNNRSASVPDPTAIMNQMKAQNQAQQAAGWQKQNMPNQQPVMNAGFQQPQMPQMPQNQSSSWAPVYQNMTPNPSAGGGFVVPSGLN